MEMACSGDLFLSRADEDLYITNYELGVGEGAIVRYVTAVVTSFGDKGVVYFTSVPTKVSPYDVVLDVILGKGKKEEEEVGSKQGKQITLVLTLTIQDFSRATILLHTLAKFTESQKNEFHSLIIILPSTDMSLILPFMPRYIPKTEIPIFLLNEKAPSR